MTRIATVSVVGGLLLGAQALVACSPEAPKASEGESQKSVMDASTKAYSDCIIDASDRTDAFNDAAGSVANRVLASCKPQRNRLMADVIVFHQIGHPKFSIDQSKAVAEASIATIEDELRRQAVVTIVSRQIAATPDAEPETAPITGTEKVE